GPRPAALPPGPRGVHRTDDPRRAAGEGLGRPGPAADRVRPGRRGGDQDAGSPGPGVDRPGGQELPDRPGVPGRTPPCGREPVRPVLRPPAARQGPAAGRPAPRTRLVVRLTDCGDPMSTPTHNPPPADLATPPRPGLGRAVWSRAGAYLALTRPKQWTKNLFVLSPLVFSGRWADGASVGLGVRAALAFGLVSGAGYCLSDSRDAAADRNHPRKRTRPVASGRVGVSEARVFGAALALAGLGLALALGPAVAGIVVLYLILNGGY